MLWVLLGILAALLLSVVLMILVRRLHLKRKLEAISQADDRTAIIQQFAYANWLMGHGQLQPHEVPNYDTVRQLQLEALYSDHTMTLQQRNQTDAFADGVLTLCQSRWDRIHRWYYHWIKCLY